MRIILFLDVVHRYIAATLLLLLVYYCVVGCYCWCVMCDNSVYFMILVGFGGDDFLDYCFCNWSDLLLSLSYTLSLVFQTFQPDSVLSSVLLGFCWCFLLLQRGCGYTR